MPGLQDQVASLEQRVEVLEARADLARLRLNLTAIWISFAKGWFRLIYEWSQSKVWLWNRNPVEGGWAHPTASQERDGLSDRMSRMGQDPPV